MRGKQELAFWGFGIPAAGAVGFAATVWGLWALIVVAVAVTALLATLLWRSAEHPAGPPAAPNWVLIAAPTLIAAASIGLAVGAAATALLAVMAFWPRGGPGPLRLTWGCMVLPAAALIVAVRSNSDDAEYRMVYFAVICAVIFRAVSVSKSKVSAMVSLADGVGLFAAVSVALWLAGVGGGYQRTSGLWNSITGGQRIIFPLSNSLTVTPALAAVFLAAAIPLLIQYRRGRWIRLVFALSAVAVCVLADSRSSLIAAVIVGLCVTLIPRAFRWAAPAAVAVTLLIAFLYSWSQAAILWALETASSFAPWLARPTLRRRDYIWDRAIEHYVERIDWVHQMFGYGAYGQAESGAVRYYWSREYGGVGNVEFATPHNSMLQLLFDGGWVTAGILLVVAVLAARTLARSGSVVGVAMLVALTIVGATEVALSPGHAQPTWWVLLAVVTIAFARPTGSDPSPSDLSPASSQTAPDPHGERAHSRTPHVARSGRPASR